MLEFVSKMSGVFVVVEHKAHGVTFAVEALDSLMKCSHQIVEGPVEHIGQHGTFYVSPQPFNQVQTWTIRGQPVDVDLMPMLFQKPTHRLSVMKATIVTNHSDSPPPIFQQQRS